MGLSQPDLKILQSVVLVSTTLISKTQLLLASALIAGIQLRLILALEQSLGVI